MVALYIAVPRILLGCTYYIESYVNYSNIAAKTLRRSLKGELKADAAKRDQSFIKVYFWHNGEILPYGEKPRLQEKDKT